MVNLAALHTDRLYSPINIPRTNFFKRLKRLQKHSTAGRIMSIINSIDTIGIGNRNRDIPKRFEVLQNIFPSCYTVDKTVIFDGLILIILWIQFCLEYYNSVDRSCLNTYKRDQNEPEIFNSFFVLINGPFTQIFSWINIQSYLIQLL
jgi:hypothetical protein